jgi:hypothetical protein
VNGSLQDYTIGTSGAFAWTIETDEPFGSSAIDQICYTNRDALMDVCNRAGWGIEGVVKDSLTGTPLYARVEVTNPERIDVYTDINLGDFHKMIAQGTYNLKISANGYAPKTVTNVNVPSIGSVVLDDVLLAPDTLYLYAFRIVICRYANHSEQNNKTQPRFALGAVDNRFFSLGRNGYVVLDMGPNIPLVDIPGDDFTIVEGNDGTAEGYTAYVSNSWDGPWSSCGSASGTASFDLAPTGLSEARYVRIVDDGSSTSGQYAGFDVDAVQFFTPIGIEEIASADAQSQMPQLVLTPNPFRRTISITVSTPGKSKLRIYSALGHCVRTFFINHSVLSTTLQWNAKNDVGQTLPAGVYFIHLTTGTNTEVKKAILLK